MDQSAIARKIMSLQPMEQDTVKPRLNKKAMQMFSLIAKYHIAIARFEHEATLPNNYLGVYNAAINTYKVCIDMVLESIHKAASAEGYLKKSLSFGFDVSEKGWHHYDSVNRFFGIDICNYTEMLESSANHTALCLLIKNIVYLQQKYEEYVWGPLSEGADRIPSLYSILRFPEIQKSSLEGQCTVVSGFAMTVLQPNPILILKLYHNPDESSKFNPSLKFKEIKIKIKRTFENKLIEAWLTNNDFDSATNKAG